MPVLVMTVGNVSNPRSMKTHILDYNDVARWQDQFDWTYMQHVTSKNDKVPSLVTLRILEDLFSESPEKLPWKEVKNQSIWKGKPVVGIIIPLCNTTKDVDEAQEYDTSDQPIAIETNQDVIFAGLPTLENQFLPPWPHAAPRYYEKANEPSGWSENENIVYEKRKKYRDFLKSLLLYKPNLTKKDVIQLSRRPEWAAEEKKRKVIQHEMLRKWDAVVAKLKQQRSPSPASPASRSPSPYRELSPPRSPRASIQKRPKGQAVSRPHPKSETSKRKSLTGGSLTGGPSKQPKVEPPQPGRTGRTGRAGTIQPPLEIKSRPAASETIEQIPEEQLWGEALPPYPGVDEEALFFQKRPERPEKPERKHPPRHPPSRQSGPTVTGPRRISGVPVSGPTAAPGAAPKPQGTGGTSAKHAMSVEEEENERQAFADRGIDSNSYMTEARRVWNSYEPDSIRNFLADLEPTKDSIRESPGGEYLLPSQGKTEFEKVLERWLKSGGPTA